MQNHTAEISPSIGICLCGGGARGIAHAGVLQALEEHGIYPTVLSGASMGAIVGALYAEELKPVKIADILSKPRFFKAFTFTYPNEGLTDLSYLKRLLRTNITEDSFEALRKQLYICVSNLNTGKAEIIHTGKLSTAVLASSAIPLIFRPVRIEGQMYVDGGLLNNLPVEPLLDKCELVIGVNVNGYGEYQQPIEGLWAIGERCANLIIEENVRPRRALCDIIIDVEEAYSYSIFDFRFAEKIYQAGYEQAQKQVGQILAKINQKPKKSTFFGFWQSGN